ncbi:hypothetical protein Tdes44962_MAKER00602 [Teratosphaeria destructans]|uniref:Uncharacterized protein n=1 Tax=Teratosphaeria destructans TaxID=418781 RepID=A0A9W7SNJ2_9PEZI|nr:hypothetical protein Tdes44962_MAKER00602 [Teratosphaeria destructans]
MASFLGLTDDDPFFGDGPLPSESFGYVVPDFTLLDSSAPQSPQTPDLPAGSGVPIIPSPPSPRDRPVHPQQRSRATSSQIAHAGEGHLDHLHGNYHRTMPDGRKEMLRIPPGLPEQEVQAMVRREDAKWLKNYKQRVRDRGARASKAPALAASPATNPSERMLAPKITSRPIDQAQMPPKFMPMLGSSLPVTPTQQPQLRRQQNAVGECSDQRSFSMQQPPPIVRFGMRPPTLPEESPILKYARRPHAGHPQLCTDSRQLLPTTGQTLMGTTRVVHNRDAAPLQLPQTSVKEVSPDGSLLLAFPDKDASNHALAALGLVAGMHESNVLIGPDGTFTWVMSGQLQPGHPSHEQLRQMYGFPAGQGVPQAFYDTASPFDIVPAMPQHGHGLQRPMPPSGGMPELQPQQPHSYFNTPVRNNLASPVTKRKHASVVNETTGYYQSKRPVTTSTKAHAHPGWATPKKSSETYSSTGPVFHGQAYNQARQTAPPFTEPSYNALHQLQEVDNDVSEHHSGSSTATASPLSVEDHLSSSFAGEDSASQQSTPATSTSSLDGTGAGKTSQKDEHQSIQPSAKDKDIDDEPVISATNLYEPDSFIDFQNENSDETFDWSPFNHEFSLW